MWLFHFNDGRDSLNFLHYSCCNCGVFLKVTWVSCQTFNSSYLFDLIYLFNYLLLVGNLEIQDCPVNISTMWKWLNSFFGQYICNMFQKMTFISWKSIICLMVILSFKLHHSWMVLSWTKRLEKSELKNLSLFLFVCIYRYVHLWFEISKSIKILFYKVD